MNYELINCTALFFRLQLGHFLFVNAELHGDESSPPATGFVARCHFVLLSYRLCAVPERTCAGIFCRAPLTNKLTTE